VIALACGEVPTLVDDIAYYTPVELPLPAVAAGDTLRDSLGHSAPLRVRAFTRDSEEITGLTVTFVPTLVPSGVTIKDDGTLIADDTIRSVQFVGQINGRFQTSVATLQIVAEPTGISRSDDPAGDTALALPALKTLPVTVSGTRRGVNTTVNGIIVRYRIDSLSPSTAPPGSAILTNAGVALRPDSTIAVDTTKSSGNATRTVVVAAGHGVQAVYISASARTLHDATPLSGSPVRWVVRIKP
jgi:hypothetical protein